MAIWDPFSPITYFLHTILGGLGVLGAIVALSVLKGSRNHVWAGRIFALAAVVAAATAIVFGFTSFSPQAIASSVMTFSAIGGAFLALRPKTSWVALAETITTIMMGMVLAWLLFGAYMSMGGDGPTWLPPLLYAVFPAILFTNDIRFKRLEVEERRRKRLGRHLSRMAFALAIAVHAPIVSFSDDLGLHPALAFFGPFILWPAIIVYFKKTRWAVADRARLAG